MYSWKLTRQRICLLFPVAKKLIPFSSADISKIKTIGMYVLKSFDVAIRKFTKHRLMKSCVTLTIFVLGYFGMFLCLFVVQSPSNWHDGSLGQNCEYDIIKQVSVSVEVEIGHFFVYLWSNHHQIGMMVALDKIVSTTSSSRFRYRSRSKLANQGGGGGYAIYVPYGDVLPIRVYFLAFESETGCLFSSLTL